MQKGFATLEVIFAAMIIALLMTVALPNAAHMLDSAALDYETKRLYSELRFLEAANKSGQFNQVATGLDLSGVNPLSIKFTSEPPSYQVVRGLDLNVTGKPVREVHYLSYGVKLSWKSGKALSTISTNRFGNLDVTSDTLILTSRRGKTKYIVFDSVGRIKGDIP